MACQTGKRLRQQPGFACEECRRRKARCDRARPKCGFCTENDMECIVIEKRQQRSPLKGKLNSMQSQLGWSTKFHLFRIMPFCKIIFCMELGVDPISSLSFKSVVPTMLFCHATSSLQCHLEQYLRPQPDLLMIPHGPIEPELEVHAHIPRVLSDCDLQALLDSQDLSVAAARPVGTTTSTSVISDSGSMPGISASTETVGLSFPVWPDWLDWQEINSTSSTPPEFLANILASPLDLEASNEKLPITSDFISKIKITDPIWAELVHAICPIIHRRRYFALVIQNNHTPAQSCLRLAMQTLAAAMSAHWCHLSEQLYSETRSLLEAQSQIQTNPRDKVPLEQIQTWLLLSHYELLRVGIHQAMLTAGRAFRLVQMARLSYIDTPGGDLQVSNLVSSLPSSASSSSSLSSFTFPPSLSASLGIESSESFVDAEERRRTFWLAFSFDRFLCLQNDWPLTLQEETVRCFSLTPSLHTLKMQAWLTISSNQISPRLPAPEENFQNNQPTRISFLHEAVAQTGISNLSPFAESIVLATLHGRCMTHRRSYANESETGTREFCISQGWLASAVEKRVQMLVSSPAIESDPILLFTHMLAYRAAIDLSNTVQRAPWRTPDQQVLTATYQNRAAQAASEIARLSKEVPYLGPFKTHPLLPDTLACAATFLFTFAGRHGGDYDGVQDLLQILGELQDTHSLARDSLPTLKIQYSKGVDKMNGIP
ncbi:Asperfuranone cluster transcription factor afoA [Penicillium malachiteum]|uniref:Asperfuranone cluster transcription factor afoA n=1 Tax=Penicillium malachiteum TaxID=1324776 RepID=UPI002546FE82|nr:Asperfuranone cluster transcription factor afoA [Penicillium malachiteum]KAJ5730547.1 Asperfuranone cluster transcription factor afoA [Penicillium malachiteum]